MKSTTRVLSVGAIAALLLPLDAGARSTFAHSSQACSSVVTLKAAGTSGANLEGKFVQQGLNAFMAANPCIKVQYTGIPSNYEQKLQAEFASHDEPDVFYLSPDLMSVYPKNNLLLKLDSYLAADKVKLSDYIPALLKIFQLNGATYGLPKDWDTLSIFYNKDIFDAKHVAYPSNDLTYAQYRALAKQMYTPSSNPAKVIYGTMMPSDDGRFSAFIYGFGSGVFDPVANKVLFNNSKAVAALDYYTSFITKDHSATIPATTGDSWQGTSFAKGRVAMVLEGGWMLPYIHDNYPKLRWGIAKFPIGPAGRVDDLYTNAWAASARTKNAAAAAKLIEYMTGATYQKTLLESGFALPSLSTLSNDPYFKSHPEFAIPYSVGLTGKPFNWGQYQTVVDTQLGNAIDFVRLGKKAPAQAIADAAKQVQAQTSTAP